MWHVAPASTREKQRSAIGVEVLVVSGSKICSCTCGEQKPDYDEASDGAASTPEPAVPQVAERPLRESSATRGKGR